MAAKNDVTGDSIQSRASNQKFREGWDRIFGNPKSKLWCYDEPVFDENSELIDSCRVYMDEQTIIDSCKNPRLYDSNEHIITNWAVTNGAWKAGS